jgi:hypothetical protein
MDRMNAGKLFGIEGSMSLPPRGSTMRTKTFELIRPNLYSVSPRFLCRCVLAGDAAEDQTLRDREAA